MMRSGFRIPIVSDAVEEIADVVSSVWDKLPGTGWVNDFTRNASEPLKDFAKSVPGQITFRALATTLYGPLAWQIGPQVATAVWALPGIFRGEPFDEAFIREFGWRMEKTAEYVAGQAGEIAGKYASQVATDQFQRATKELEARARQAFPNLSLEDAARSLGVHPDQLAKELGVRPDMVAAALAAITRDLGLAERIRDLYNLATGKSYEQERYEAMIRQATQVSLAQSRQQVVYDPKLAALSQLRPTLDKTRQVLGVSSTVLPPISPPPGPPVSSLPRVRSVSGPRPIVAVSSPSPEGIAIASPAASSGTSSAIFLGLGASLALTAGYLYLRRKR